MRSRMKTVSALRRLAQANLPGFWSRVWLLAPVALCGWRTGATPHVDREALVLRGVDQAQLFRESSLLEYTVTEKYAVRNLRFHTAAEMIVTAAYHKGTGKTYQVVSKSGSPVLQTRILDKLLAGEVEMSRGANLQHSRVTSENYKMRLLGGETIDGRPCEALELVPRVKKAQLLAGRAWVDATDYSLVRIEGRPTASLSFFAGRPLIVREYDHIDGLAMARRSQAVSDSLLFGRTELTIEYSGYKVARVPPK